MSAHRGVLTKPAKRALDAPPDQQCHDAWDRIMQLATKFGLIAQAYGGVATLALPREQRTAGIRDRVLQAHDMNETEDVLT